MELEMEIEITKDKIRKAIQTFITEDKEELSKIDIYEPTLSHRIALYLEPFFHTDEINVDCEYNRHLSGKKKSGNGICIRPDIIIHHRTDDSANLVMIEVKKHGKDSKPAKKDIEKLKECMEEPYYYTLGVFIGILKRKIDVCWIEKKNNTVTVTPEEI